MQVTFDGLRMLIVATALVINTLCSSGCLSIGGKNYTSQENPQTGHRLSALENRVGVLEQAMLGAPAQYGNGHEAVDSSH